MLAGPRGQELREYWSRTLAGELPVSTISSDEPTPTSTPLAGASLPFTFGATLSDAIYAVAKTHATTLYTMVLVATQMLLHRLGGQTDVIVGTPVALRQQAEFTDVVGYFVNTVPIRGTVNSDDTFAALLGRARDQVIGALDHQEYPFSLLVDRLQVRRESRRNPIFQVMLNVLVSSRSSELFRNLTSREREVVMFGDSAAVPYVLPQQEGQFELTVEVFEHDGLLSGNLHFQTALYSEERATEIRDAFVALLSAAVANPAARVGDLELPSREQFEL
jgi:non-ribosomal peptide synthetase component F